MQVYYNRGVVVQDRSPGVRVLAARVVNLNSVELHVGATQFKHHSSESDFVCRGVHCDVYSVKNSGRLIVSCGIQGEVGGVVRDKGIIDSEQGVGRVEIDFCTIDNCCITYDINSCPIDVNCCPVYFEHGSIYLVVRRVITYC